MSSPSSSPFRFQYWITKSTFRKEKGSQPGPGGFLKFQIKYGLRCHCEKPYPVQRISTTFGISFFLRSGNSRFPMGMRDGIKAIATFLAPGMKLRLLFSTYTSQ
ncbi:hypothetical protein Salat_0853700, partial [Sesamum alatum]